MLGWRDDTNSLHSLLLPRVLGAVELGHVLVPLCHGRHSQWLPLLTHSSSCLHSLETQHQCTTPPLLPSVLATVCPHGMAAYYTQSTDSVLDLVCVFFTVFGFQMLCFPSSLPAPLRQSPCHQSPFQTPQFSVYSSLTETTSKYSPHTLPRRK